MVHKARAKVPPFVVFAFVHNLRSYRPSTAEPPRHHAKPADCRANKNGHGPSAHLDDPGLGRKRKCSAKSSVRSEQVGGSCGERRRSCLGSRNSLRTDEQDDWAREERRKERSPGFTSKNHFNTIQQLFEYYTWRRCNILYRLEWHLVMFWINFLMRYSDISEVALLGKIVPLRVLKTERYG